MAECSESIGRSQCSAPRRRRPRPCLAQSRASGMTRWPPATSVSLLAVATILPASSAASDRPQADDAGRADQHQVDVVARGHVLERGRAVLARAPSRRGRWRATCSSNVASSRPAGQRDHLERSGVRRQHVERLAPDRARAAQHRDPHPVTHAGRLTASRREATSTMTIAGAAKRNESTGRGCRRGRE